MKADAVSLFLCEFNNKNNQKSCHILLGALIAYLVESTFLDLRCKEVVNVLDGRKLGHIIDMVFDLGSARVLGFIVPGERTGWNLFKNANQLFVPYGCIIKIGEDAILVELPAQGVPTNPYVLTNERK